MAIVPTVALEPLPKANLPAPVFVKVAPLPATVPVNVMVVVELSTLMEPPFDPTVIVRFIPAVPPVYLNVPGFALDPSLTSLAVPIELAVPESAMAAAVKVPFWISVIPE